jgi:hypothetical protein
MQRAPCRAPGCSVSVSLSLVISIANIISFVVVVVINTSKQQWRQNAAI